MSIIIKHLQKKIKKKINENESNEIFKKFLDKYKGNNKDIIKNKDLLKNNFFNQIYLTLDIYNDNQIESIIKWGYKQYVYVSNLSTEDKNILSYWVRNAGYNAWKKFTKEYKERLNEIILNSPSLDCDLIVYRGSAYPYYYDSKIFDKKTSIYTLDQVLSTTSDMGVAEGFTNHNNCCYMMISLTKGSKCLILFKEVAGVEAEIILPFNTKLKLIDEVKNFRYIREDEEFKLITTIWEIVPNNDSLLEKSIDEFCNKPSQKKFLKLDQYVQKYFKYYAKIVVNLKKGDLNLANKILKY